MLARLTHVVDDYPKWWPEDPEAFIVPPRELGAWVAEDDGVVVGHVALQTPADDPTFDQVRRATGRDAAAVAVVARLFSSPDVRGRGIGWALLTEAEQAAHAVGRLPILDVGKAQAARPDHRARSIVPNGRRATFFNLWTGRARHLDRHRSDLRRDLGAVLALLAEGAIVPQVARRFPLEEAAAAMRYAEATPRPPRTRASQPCER